MSIPRNLLTHLSYLTQLTLVTKTTHSLITTVLISLDMKTKVARHITWNHLSRLTHVNIQTF